MFCVSSLSSCLKDFLILVNDKIHYGKQIVDWIISLIVKKEKTLRVQKKKRKECHDIYGIR